MDPRLVLCGGKYCLEKLIGEGAFGKIYSARCEETKSTVAIKLEPLEQRNSQLLVEAKVYKLLQGRTGIPKLFQVCTEGDYNILVMELLGPSIEGLFQMCNKRLSIPTLLTLAEQMIERIETFHSKGLLHRDIKPDNYTIGINECSNTVYIIDYGLAKRYRSTRTHMHIPMREGKKLIGTARYSSINTHLGLEQSRRDDLECLGYSLLYLARGALPWQGLGIENKKEKYEKTFEMKTEIGIDALCKGLPIEFARYMYYCRELRFEDKPDYKQLKNQFKECFQKLQENTPFVFDWNLLKTEFIAPLHRMRQSNDASMAASPIAEEEDSHGKFEDSSVEDKRKNKRQADIEKLLSGLPPSLRPKLKKEPLSKAKIEKEPTFEEKKAESAIVGHDRFSFMNTDFMPKPAEGQQCLNEILENFLCTPSTVGEGKNVSNGVKPEAKMQENLLELSKIVTPQFFRQITRELSDRSSCNFNLLDILENPSLFGMNFDERIVILIDETIPQEKPVNISIKVPMCSYINNTRHWMRNRRKRKYTKIRRTKTEEQANLLKPPRAPAYLKGTGRSLT